MKNIITFLVITACQFLNAQYSISGTFTDKDSDIYNIALYKIVKGEENYVKYVDAENQNFTISMDNLPVGNYRAVYQGTKQGSVDFVYNNENIKFSIDSRKGQSSIEFLESRENQLLYAYHYNINFLQQKLDSMQLAYFNKPGKRKRKYKKVKSKIDGAQQYYEDLAKNDYCLTVIKASKRYNAPLPYALPSEYLTSVKNHFFDYIDFKDSKLRNSFFIKNKLKNYVLYLHKTENIIAQNEDYITAIQQILSKTNDGVFKEEVLRFFIPIFVNKENIEVSSAIIDLYKELPREFLSEKLLSETEIKTRTLIGVKAPNIKISKTENLHNLKESDHYLVVFWSSGCSHCAKELPKLKTLLKSKNNYTVITVGLEEIDSEFHWKTLVEEKYKGWKNVIALGKWDSKLAKTYDIHATPSYFLLDKNKKIIAKPTDFEALKDILE